MRGFQWSEIKISESTQFSLGNTFRVKTLSFISLSKIEEVEAFCNVRKQEYLNYKTENRQESNVQRDGTLLGANSEQEYYVIFDDRADKK